MAKTKKIPAEEPIEKQLASALMEVKPRFQDAFKKREFDACFNLYENAFSDLIHQFFDTVLVNVEDENIRFNRKVLMKQINALLCDTIANLSFLRM